MSLIHDLQAAHRARQAMFFQPRRPPAATPKFRAPQLSAEAAHVLFGRPLPARQNIDALPVPPRLPDGIVRLSDEEQIDGPTGPHIPDPDQIVAPSVLRIIGVVSRFYRVSRVSIISARRTKQIILPRQVAMYLARELTVQSLPEIGRRFNGRDHTTVMHAVRKISRLIESNPDVAADVNRLRAELGR